MSNIKKISTPGTQPSPTSFKDDQIVINTADGKLYIKSSGRLLRVVNQDFSKDTPLDGNIIINETIEFKKKNTSDSILFLKTDNNNPRVGIGTKDPQSTLDFRDAEDSTIGTELILRTARLTKGAELGDEGGSINFTIDSSSFFNLKTSGSLAKIKTLVNQVGVGGVQGKLVFELSKGASPEGNDVFSYGFSQISDSNFNLYSQIQSASLLIKDFSPTGYSVFEMRDSSDDTKLKIFKGNITASGNISASGVSFTTISTTNITASGNISASGNIYANDLDLAGSIISHQLNVQGSITASGDISASGDLQGSQLNITKNIPKLVLNTNTSNVYSQIDGTSGNVRIDVDNGNQSGNSTFGVRIDTAGTNQLSLNTDGELTLTGGITASGDISSSGNIVGIINGGTF